MHANGPHRLVVLFHGLAGRSVTDVRAVVRETMPGADVLVPGYSGSMLSNETPSNIVREYLVAIDDATATAHYDEITLVGYSVGAASARRLASAGSSYRSSEASRSFRISDSNGSP